MGKIKPSSDKKKKRKAARRAELSNASGQNQDPQALLSAAVAFLHQGEPESALPLAQEAAARSGSAQLLALSLLGEINVELGDPQAALEAFTKCAELDPEGMTEEAEGGGPEKFLWLAQLSENGGRESIGWYEKGVVCLEKAIADNTGKAGAEADREQDDRRKKLESALCGMCEVWMTDLSFVTSFPRSHTLSLPFVRFEDEAEGQCEALISRAMLVSPTPHAPTLQTLASIRLSQSRLEEAQTALSRSLEPWYNLDSEHPDVPDFATRISLSRLLMEAGMEEEALQVVERLVGEDDQSVEAWYLGGWCLWLMVPNYHEEGAAEIHLADRRRLQLSSREWLRNCLKLYQLLDYEDDRLRDHALELVAELDKDLGNAEIEDEDSNEGDWEEEDSVDEAAEDNEMDDS